MEFKSLKDLVRIVENSLAVEFLGVVGRTVTVLRKTVLKVLAKVWGGCLYLLVLLAKKIWKNRFCHSCEVSALDGYGTEYGVPHKAPVKANGYVRVTLADGVESVTIQRGTVLTDESSNIEYEVEATSTITSELNGLPVVAADYGTEYNLEEGVVLSFRDGDVTGVESLEAYNIGGGVLVEVEIDGEVQQWGETAEEYRSRLVNRIQNPVNGGSDNDYWRWATRFQFVTDAFVISNKPNTNSVSVAVANYNGYIAITDANQLAEVKKYLTDDVRRPVTADVHVFSVTPVPVSIMAYVTPYNDSVKYGVSAAIKQFLRSVKPGETVSLEKLSLVALSNSTAETFVIGSVQKNGTAVSSLAFALDFSVDSETGEEIVLAEVAKCAFTFQDGST